MNDAQRMECGLGMADSRAGERVVLWEGGARLCELMGRWADRWGS